MKKILFLLLFIFLFSNIYPEDSPIADEDDLERTAYYQDILIHKMELNTVSGKYLERLPGCGKIKKLYNGLKSCTMNNNVLQYIV